MKYRYCFDTRRPHKKFTCPSCQHKNVFTRYVDTQTGEYLPEKYGKCDRENNCTYHLNPYKDGYNKRIWKQEKENGIFHIPQVIFTASQSLSYISETDFRKTLKNYEENNFALYLIKQFGTDIAIQLIERYLIGTSKHQFFKPNIHPDYVSPKGATIFWLRDIRGRNTAGKVMLYNPDTGKRLKNPFDHVDSVHHLLSLPEPRPFVCLFGEHLLKNEPRKPIAIVESEKTAIIASAYFKEFIWLATGSLSMLTYERCKVLAGRKVVLFPDLNGFEKWKNKVEELSTITNFTVSDFLQRHTSNLEKEQGLDIADYL